MDYGTCSDILLKSSVYLICLAFIFNYSLYGAYQLQLDFGHMQYWLQQKLSHSKVKQSVMSLDVFKNLMGIVELLKQQPRGRLHSRTRNTSRREESSMCEFVYTLGTRRFRFQHAYTV